MPEDNINKRMNYFDRQFLRASDFQVEQQYHMDRHRRHNRLLHTPGVATAHDLTVTGNAGGLSITLTAGTAIDKEGREIILLAPKPIPLPFDLGESLEVVITFQDRPDDPSSDPGVKGFTRFTEDPHVQIVGSEIAPELKQMINDGIAFRLAKMEVKIDENAKTATLRTEPDNTIRTLAGIVAGTGMTFATVTASSLQLKQGNNPTVQITSDGTIDSPMWSVVLSEKNVAGSLIAPKAVIKEIPFPTKGGDLLIFASGSVSLASGTPQPTGTAIGINIFLDDAESALGGEPSVPGCAIPGHLHTAVTTTLFAPGGRSARRTLKLKAAVNTQLLTNDFYSVTILELPFKKAIS